MIMDRLTTLTNALHLRGFLVTQHEDHIYLHQGNHQQDINDLEVLFNEHNIPATLHNRNIYLNHQEDQPINDQVIIWHKAYNHESWIAHYGGFKYFTKSIHGPKIRTLSLETGVALMVKAISAAGITTFSSCDGHGQRAPRIDFHGKHNACWFQLHFHKMLRETNLSFNYQWTFQDKDKPFLDLVLKAISPSGRYKKHLVLEDSLKIAAYFLQQAQAISLTKRQLFKINRNRNRKLIKPMTFDELYDWMEEKYLQFQENNVAANV